MNLLFDIGGTKTRIAFHQTGEDFFSEPEFFETPKEYEKIIEIFKEIKKNNPEKIKKIIGGIPAVFNKKNEPEFIFNLPNWPIEKLKIDLESIFPETDILIINDTKLVSIGESFFGAGKKINDLCYLTISTGVGGFFIKDKNLLDLTSNPEIGHSIINNQAIYTAEDLISGQNMSSEFSCNIKDIPHSIWKKRSKEVAILIHNINMYWQPKHIIIGGSMITKEIGFKIEDISIQLQKLPKVYKHQTLLILAELGSLGGLWGALFLANQKNISFALLNQRLHQ